MHLEFLVEDSSGKEALTILIPKILGLEHTFKIHSYRGIGRLPKNLRTTANPQHRALFAQLPKILQGYGRVTNKVPRAHRPIVVVVCDLDGECQHSLRASLMALHASCSPRPEAHFCIAVEELEAWFLGDTQAILSTYSRAKEQVLSSYVPDSICGTWEVLADAVHSGGFKILSSRQYFEIGAAKCTWAREIASRMNVEENASPSFRYFRDRLRRVVQ